MAKAIDLAAKENKLILKDFGKHENKNKTYYWYNTGTNQPRHPKIVLLDKVKKLHELKFTSAGIFMNTHWFFLVDAKEKLLLWKDVEKVIIKHGVITFCFCNTRKTDVPKEDSTWSEVHSLSGLSHGAQLYIANKIESCVYLREQENEIFLKLIQTFYDGEITQRA